MNIEMFDRKEAMLDLQERLLQAEQQRLDGEPSFTLDEVQQRLKDKTNKKI